VSSELSSFVSLNNLPLDYSRLLVAGGAGPKSVSADSLSAAVFFSGIIIAIGYPTAPQKAGLVYFASMAAYALRAIAPVPLLPLIEGSKLVIISHKLLLSKDEITSLCLFAVFVLT